MEKDDNARLEAEDMNDPLYVALRADMIAKARLDCVQSAIDGGYHSIECDPDNAEDDASAHLAPVGPCDETDVKLVKGSPDYCLMGLPSGTTEWETTTVTGADTGVPTTTEGDTGVPTTTESDTGMSTTTEGDTGSFTVTGDDTEQGLGDLDTLINCSFKNCLVSQDLIDATLENPHLLVNDSTRLVQHMFQITCNGTSPAPAMALTVAATRLGWPSPG
jgi:hypothetical protein